MTIAVAGVAFMITYYGVARISSRCLQVRYAVAQEITLWIFVYNDTLLGK